MKNKLVITTLWCIMLNHNILVSSGQGTLNLVSHCKKGGISYGVCADNGYAYITTNKGVVAFDVHNPSKPKKISDISIGVTFGIYLQNDMAYILGGEKLIIADISDPVNPKILQDYDFKEYSQCLKVAGDYLYIASETGLEILDISNPAKIEPVAHVGDSWYRSVDMCDGIAYVVNYQNGLEVIDVSNPFSPVNITTVPGTKKSVNIHIHDDYLYLARADSGISILSISNRKSPRVIGNFCDDDNGESKDLWGNGNYLYVQDGFGVEVLDVSDPANPYEIDEIEGAGGHEIYSDSKLVFIATGLKGLIILEFKDNGDII